MMRSLVAASATMELSRQAATCLAVKALPHGTGAAAAAVIPPVVVVAAAAAVIPLVGAAAASVIPSVGAADLARAVWAHRQCSSHLGFNPWGAAKQWSRPNLLQACAGLLLRDRAIPGMV